MIVAIHQPCFMPWLGYLHRMAQADVFVLLDHVQFERGNFQNRTRIRLQDEARWLTVPVLQHSQGERILDKEIDNRGEGARHWSAVHAATLRHAYREAPYLGLYMAALKEIFSARWTHLVALNQALLELLRDAFGIRTPVIRSSELGVQGAKSELVLEICQALGAKTFLGGMGGSRSYLDREAFARAGVEVRWQTFQHPLYAQCGAKPFVAGLSSVDLLLNCGPQGRHLFLSQAAAHRGFRVAA